jgi:hypothetical protein
VSEIGAGADSTSMVVRLQREEALVLFDLLSRWLTDERGHAVCEYVEDDAELWALNGLLCSLETTLVEPFQHDYGDLISRAREEVRVWNGGKWQRQDGGSDLC